MDTLLIHALNSLLYAAVLFLIAGGLSLIYGVMRIVNLAHGSLYAFGAFVAAWMVGRLVAGPTPTAVLYLVLAAGAVVAAGMGATLEPSLLRPIYKRPEEYQLLITFGLQLILEDLMRLIWGPYPLSVSALFEGMGSLNIGDSTARSAPVNAAAYLRSSVPGTDGPTSVFRRPFDMIDHKSLNRSPRRLQF